MHIVIFFQFNNEALPIATTGVAGEVCDLLLPSVGDLVQHSDAGGKPFQGKVTDRIFTYNLPAGDAIDGMVSVTLRLDPTTIQ